MTALKRIAKDSVARALEKAERYRLLNEPRAAESICLDVLAIEPEHQQALACMLLALADQFSTGAPGLVERAKQLLPRLAGEYEQAYYAGIISERYARQQLVQYHPGAGFSAYEYLQQAMSYYEKAEALAPKGNDDAILRYNTCVRMIERHHLVAPSHEEHELPLE